MRHLIWRPAAKSRLLQIYQHISADNPHAADQLVEHVEKAVGSLLNHPYLYRLGRKQGTREMVAHPNY